MERDLMADTAALRPASMKVNRRLTFVRWVRKTHGWFGLWGALLGLMMGISGVWLNHRATLKLELPAQTQMNAQLALPDPAPATAPAMAAWLQQTLKLDRAPAQQRVEKARPVPWAEKGGAEKPLMTPERWFFVFGGPNRVVQVEYFAGNKSAHVRTTSNGFIATLTNLHKGTTMPVPWILLIDTMAGSLIFLSISGLILWWETNRRRRLGIAIFGVSVLATVGLAVWPMQT
ncbi:MAG: PepSY-associated TM helix domain-containing protein [Proteobacteria bacterium]|nr:PepSY-associated TM helix domain-containing protein [Pseudomonadota bacterium]